MARIHVDQLGPIIQQGGQALGRGLADLVGGALGVQTPGLFSIQQQRELLDLRRKSVENQTADVKLREAQFALRRAQDEMIRSQMQPDKDSAQQAPAAQPPKAQPPPAAQPPQAQQAPAVTEPDPNQFPMQPSFSPTQPGLTAGPDETGMMEFKGGVVTTGEAEAERTLRQGQLRRAQGIPTSIQRARTIEGSAVAISINVNRAMQQAVNLEKAAELFEQSPTAEGKALAKQKRDQLDQLLKQMQTAAADAIASLRTAMDMELSASDKADHPAIRAYYNARFSLLRSNFQGLEGVEVPSVLNQTNLDER